jgi:hypothetical protein
MQPRWVASSRADFPGWSGFVRPKGRFASCCLLEILTTIHPRLQRPTKLVVKSYVLDIRKRPKNSPVAFTDPPDLEAASIQGCVTRSLTSLPYLFALNHHRLAFGGSNASFITKVICTAYVEEIYYIR